MSKKRIIMIAAAGLVSFAATFIFVWFTQKKTPPSQSPQMNQLTLADQEAELKLPPPEAGTMGTVAADDITMKKSMTEKQLKSLVHDVREKMQKYNNKLKGLELKEQRLQIAQDVLKEDVEELNNLRVELTSIVASLKGERDKLLKSRVGVAQAEKTNLMSIAATYDKMDSASAGKILTNMKQMKSDGLGGSSGLDDAVKILHYMTERTRAKLLAELVTSEPKLAAVLCRRLKQIIEEE